MNATKNILLLNSIALTALIAGSVSAQVNDSGRVSIDRYATVVAEPHASQLDLMSVIVDVKFDKSIKTVGEAVKQLLATHGFRLGEITAGGYSQYVLYLLPLPDIHRHLGPMSLEAALQVLGGESFDLKVNPVTREVNYRIREAYDDFLPASEAVIAKNEWDKTSSPSYVGLKLSKDQCGGKTDGSHYGPVTEGEYLSKIAAKVKSHSSTLEQAMMAIFDMNSAAFGENNINYLRRGVVLNIPSQEGMVAKDQALAKRQVREHHQMWLQQKAAQKVRDVVGMPNAQ